MNEQVQSILKQLSITQRIGIIFAALGSVAAIAVLVMFASKPDYTPAFTNLTAADAGTIESALRGANIAYEVADAGATIEVPVDSARRRQDRGRERGRDHRTTTTPRASTSSTTSSSASRSSTRTSPTSGPSKAS